MIYLTSPNLLILLIIGTIAYFFYSILRYRKGDRIMYCDEHDSHIAIFIRKLPKNKCEIRLKDTYEIVPFKNVSKI